MANDLAASLNTLHERLDEAARALKESEAGLKQVEKTMGKAAPTPGGGKSLDKSPRRPR